MDSCWPAGNLGCHSSCPSRRNSTSDPASSVFHHSPQVSLGGALRTGLLVSPGASGLSKPATDGPKGAPWRAHPGPFLANPWGALMRTQSLPLGGRKQLVELSEKYSWVCGHTQRWTERRGAHLLKDLGPIPSGPRSYYISSGSELYQDLSKHTKPPCLVKLVSAGLQSLGAKNSD